jgi:hypothetical protein
LLIILSHRSNFEQRENSAPLAQRREAIMEPRTKVRTLIDRHTAFGEVPKGTIGEFVRFKLGRTRLDMGFCEGAVVKFWQKDTLPRMFKVWYKLEHIRTAEPVKPKIHECDFAWAGPTRTTPAPPTPPAVLGFAPAYDLYGHAEHKRYMRRERLRKHAAERELADALHRVMTSAFCRPGEDER